MNITAIATVALAIAMPLLGQELAAPQSDKRSAGSFVAADFDYEVKSCGVGQTGGEAMLFATVARMPLDTVEPAQALREGGVVQKGREKGRQIVAGPGGGPNVDYPRRGVAFTVAPSLGGGMPVVSLADAAPQAEAILLPAVQKTRDAAARMAINTKGTGATNGRACDAPPAVTAAAALCSVSGDPAAPDVRFSMPVATLAPAGSGQPVTAQLWLSKKGYDYYHASSSMVVATCTSDKMTATYDLKMAKK